jgi:glyoxylase-like metal-dependent hydrolase (beta-lactamase superfamily II)
MPPLRTLSGPSRRAKPELIEVKPGIFFVKNVRAGINAFFADMGDFVLAYDAPADYRLIDEIPPGRLAPGSTSNSVTEELLRLVAGALPDKPVRYAVISHHHSDHLGGVRAYLRSGTEVVVPAGIGELVARVARAPHRIAEGSNERSFHDPAVTEVSEERVIEGASRTARIRFIDNAPHARAMLVVEFPLDRLMFTGDLFYPNSLDRFPNPNREPIMRFFVEWLDRNELAPEIVLGSHAAVPGTDEHLAVIRRRAQ